MSHHQKLVKDPKTGRYSWVDIKKARGNATDLPPSNAYSSAKPYTSVAMGVPAHCAKERSEMLRKLGIVGARFRPDGVFEADSRKARNDTLRAMGQMDMDAGYGDWAGH